MSFLRTYWGLIAVLLLCVPTILPFFHSGFFPMHDDTQVVRVYEMGRALSDGMFPVRWVEDLGYGYGYPIFNFYSPLPYYVGGILTLFGFDALFATKITFIIGILLSGVFMYFLVRSFSNEIAAMTSAIFYVYFPYHAVNVYVRGALGELYAYAFLPIVFYGLYGLYKSYSEGLDKVQKRKHATFIDRVIPFGKKWVLVTSLGITFVVLSHNLYAFMLVLILALFFVISLFFNKHLRFFIALFLAMLFGFLLSAFYAFPAFLEMQWTNVASQIGGGADYRDHFVCLSQLWESIWGYGGSAVGCVDGMSFRIGKLHIILFVISLGLFVYQVSKKRFAKSFFIYITSLVLGLFSLFMMLDISEFIWRVIPYIDFLQYPWRFLGFVGLFLSIFVSLSLITVPKRFFLQFGLVAALLVILFNQKLFVPQFYLNKTSESYTDLRNIVWDTSKISDEYLPRKFKKPMSEEDLPTQKMSLVTGKGNISDISSKTQILTAKADIQEKALIKIYQANFPWWHVYANNREIEKLFSFNGMYIELSEGIYNLEIRFEQTDIQKGSNMITILSVVLIVTGIIKHRNLKHHEETS